MSDGNKLKELGFEPDPSDYGFESDDDTTPPREFSKLESAQKGLEQGVTFGLADEGQGFMGAGMDATQALLNKLGAGASDLTGLDLNIVSPSPSQVNAKLAEEGFKGDIGPTSIGDAYSQTRDSARKEYDQAQEANPLSYLGGAIAGGALTGKVAGQVLSPFTVAKEAGLGAKVATGALNSINTAGIAGLGLSKGKNIEEIGDDVGRDTLIGMGIGGALPAVGAGLSKGKEVAGEFIENNLPSVARAFEKGKEGISTTAKSFADATNEKLGALTNKLKEHTLKARDAVRKQNDEAIEGLNTQIKDVQDDIQKEMKLAQDDHKRSIENTRINIDSASDDLKQSVQSQKAKVNTERGVKKDALEQEKIGLADRIQAKILSAKDAIKATYDKVENQIAGSNITFDVREPVSHLEETLLKNGLTPNDARQFAGQFDEYIQNGPVNLQQFKQMKVKMSNYLDSANPAIRGAFKQSYGKLNQHQIEQLGRAGLHEVAGTLKNANHKFMSIMDMEENFLGKLQADKVLKENLIQQGTLNSINKATTGTAKGMVSTDEFVKKLQHIDPSMEQEVIPQLQQLIEKAKALKVRPSVNANDPMFQQKQAAIAELENKLAQMKQMAPQVDVSNQEKSLAELQKQMTAAKTPPEVKTQMDALMNSDEKQINDYLGNNIKNVNNPLMEPNRQNMENVLESYRKATGQNLKGEAQELIKDTELIKSGKQGLAATVSPRGLKFGESTLQGPANKVGLAVNKVQSAKAFLSKGIQSLSDADEAVMGHLVNKMSQVSPKGAEYAKVLSEAMSKNKVSKNAIMFGLMQQPEFRKLFHEVNNVGSADGQ